MYKWTSGRVHRVQKMGQWDSSIFLYSIILFRVRLVFVKDLFKECVILCVWQQMSLLKLPTVAHAWASFSTRPILKSQQRHCGRSKRQLAKQQCTWRARIRCRRCLPGIAPWSLDSALGASYRFVQGSPMGQEFNVSISGLVSYTWDGMGSECDSYSVDALHRFGETSTE